MIYRIDEFIENRINPITQCEYDGSWIMLILTDSDEYQKFVGSKNECTYTVKISRRKCKDWMMDIGDFISFNEANGKNIILVMPEIDYLTVQDYYSGHSYNESVHRESEPVVLVHSTSMANWKKIQQDGMLKCWSRLKRENKTSETVPIGTALGDPVEFSDYIMFGEGITGEIVVNSKQTGRITMDVDSEYLTGARLYFDTRKIAEAGLLIRDGSHLKVRDTLPLHPYLIWSATWENIGLKSQISTPRIFAEKSDQAFQRHKI